MPDGRALGVLGCWVTRLLVAILGPTLRMESVAHRTQNMYDTPC